MTGILALCVILSAFFSASETAFAALNPIRLKTMPNVSRKKVDLVLSLS